MLKKQIQKYIPVTAFLAFLASFTFLTGHVFAEECTTVFCGGGLREGLDKTKPELRGKGISTSDSLITVILGLVEFALPFAGLFAFVGVVYGGFLYVTSFAEDQTEKARNILFWSAMGLIMIFVAYPFVATLIRFQT